MPIGMPIIQAVLLLTQSDRHRAPIGSYEVVPGAIPVQACLRLVGQMTPPASEILIFTASVLVYKKASNKEVRKVLGARKEAFSFEPEILHP